MSEYKLKPGKIGETVIGAYKTIEDTVVGSYKKMEDAFVDAFLEKTNGPVEDVVPAKSK